MPDGVYSMVFYYGDTSSHPDAYSMPIVFTLRTVTPPVTYNTSSLLFTSLIPFNISIYVPVIPGANSFTVTLISGTNPSARSYVLYSSASFPFGQSYLLLPYTVADDSNYTLCITYSDPVSNPPVTSCLYGIWIQYFTYNATLYNPIGGQVFGPLDAISFNYSLNDPLGALPGTVQLRLYNTGTPVLVGTINTSTLVTNNSVRLNVSTFKAASLFDGTNCPLSPSKFTDGTYDVVLVYQDSFDNPLSRSNLVVGIMLILGDQTPIILSPVPGGHYNALPVNFTLPYLSALTSPVIIYIRNSSAPLTKAIQLNVNSSITTVYLFNTTTLLPSSYIFSNTLDPGPYTISDTTYNFSLGFSDLYYHPYVFSPTFSIVIDHVAPTITWFSPPSDSVFVWDAASTTTIWYSESEPLLSLAIVFFISGTSTFQIALNVSTVILNQNDLAWQFPDNFFTHYTTVPPITIVTGASTETLPGDTAYDIWTYAVDLAGNPTYAKSAVNVYFSLLPIVVAPPRPDLITVGAYSFTTEQFAGVVVACVVGGFIVITLIYHHLCKAPTRRVYNVVSD